MTAGDLLLLLPVICPGAAAALAAVAIAVRRRHATVAVIAVVGLLAGILSVLSLSPGRQPVTALWLFDGVAAVGAGVVLTAALAVTLFAWSYMAASRRRRPEEFYVLLLVAASGAAALAGATHFASFFLGIEMLSVSLFAMVAYERSRDLGIEAGVKYLVLAAFSSAFLLFGIALVYANMGALQFQDVAQRLEAAGTPNGALLGLAMILVGVGFKLAVVPFHQWAPDVYQGAPPPAGAFVATVSKGAVFVGVLRLFVALDAGGGKPVAAGLAVLAAASMLAGNLLALRQTSLKRILAYSSIAHVGYMLVALLAGGEAGVPAALFYLLVYFLSTLTAWGVIGEMSTSGSEADALDGYRGLAWRRPWLAAALTLAMLSLAGLPITAGLIGKFYIVWAGVSARLWTLVGALVAGSAVGLYYYLRVLAAVFSRTADGQRPAVPERAGGLVGRLTLGAAAVLLVVVGILPGPGVHLIAALASALR